MNVTLAELISWLTVGALAGYVVGLILRQTGTRPNHLANLGVGMVGALVGGYLFDLLRIAEALEAFSVSLRDVVAAVVGSLLFVGAIRIVRNYRRRAKQGAAG